MIVKRLHLTQLQASPIIFVQPHWTPYEVTSYCHGGRSSSNRARRSAAPSQPDHGGGQNPHRGPSPEHRAGIRFHFPGEIRLQTNAPPTDLPPHRTTPRRRQLSLFPP